MIFIDRETELAALERAWESPGAEMIVIYGKRRVGKTELIKQFIRDRPHLYFLAQKISARDNLKFLADLTADLFGDDVLKRTGFPDWHVFFRYGRDRIKNRLVVVVDEFPYLAEAEKGISSVFQSGWDEDWKRLPVVFILCGSSIAMMESEVLAQKSPLFGRRTGQILVKPFRFAEARKFFPGAQFDECLETFSITGGNPSYLQKFDPGQPLERNIAERILRPDAFLSREVEFVLREELRELRNYFAILRAIALGKCRIGEIVNETGLEKGILHKYLFTLEDLQVVEKEVPVTEDKPLKSRRGIYRIQDQYFKFWFRHVLPNRGRIEEGRIEPVLKRIREDLATLASENYERLAADLLIKHERELFPIDRVGRWWDRQGEVDVVALNEETKTILFGEAKWSRRPVGIDVLENLMSRAPRVGWNRDGRKERFVLFSRSGFTEALKTKAEKENVLLFHKDELVFPGKRGSF